MVSSYLRQVRVLNQGGLLLPLLRHPLLPPILQPKRDQAKKALY
jgi:hypothetical protein